ncbi:MAG: DNA integrity scanning protein DisA nucleotide-binding domain protein [Eubacterium sp.]
MQRPQENLLKTFFYPKSPLHDGAMVIRDGKIYAAGCILPLTKKDCFVCTRHKAQSRNRSY